jgi:hypothetical protein
MPAKLPKRFEIQVLAVLADIETNRFLLYRHP